MISIRCALGIHSWEIRHREAHLPLPNMRLRWPRPPELWRVKGVRWHRNLWFYLKKPFRIWKGLTYDGFKLCHPIRLPPRENCCYRLCARCGALQAWRTYQNSANGKWVVLFKAFVVKPEIHRMYPPCAQSVVDSAGTSGSSSTGARSRKTTKKSR